MVKENKLITAAEARQLAETSTWMINHIDKIIKHVAAENRHKATWDVSDCCPEVLRAIKDSLEQRDFKVSHTTFEDDDGIEQEYLDEITIEW